MHASITLPPGIIVEEIWIACEIALHNSESRRAAYSKEKTSAGTAILRAGMPIGHIFADQGNRSGHGLINCHRRSV